MTREEAVGRLKDLRFGNWSVFEEPNEIVTTGEAFDMAIEALSVDLIRCGECKHWYNDADTGTACEFTNMHEDADGYCSYGERRSGETD